MRVAVPKRVYQLWRVLTGRLFRKRRPSVDPGTMELARECVERGRRLYNSKSYEAAIEEFRQAMTIVPHYQRALYFLGNACYKASQHEHAVRYWKQCISVEPTTRFAELSRSRIQHVDKHRHTLKNELDEFYKRMKIH